MPDHLGALYARHLNTMTRRTAAALAAGGFDRLLIGSGHPRDRFLDDMPYPFHANPHFLAWLPLDQHPDCWLSIEPGQRPKLFYYQPDDYWHLPPEDPAGFFVEHFDITIIRDVDDIPAALGPLARAAIIAETNAAIGALVPNNPAAVLDLLHYHRAYKTPYEIARMRAASGRAVAGHLAAEKTFRAGGSERAIHEAYLSATGHRDDNLPYGNIVALDRHAAVLHYQYQSSKTPKRNRSLLIDAGAADAGYAADITRTYARDTEADADFAALIQAVDRVQRKLVDGVRPGRDYRELHLDAHRRLGEVLAEAGVLRIGADEAVAKGITATFFPHGLGHLIGLQVHDVAGFAAGPDGGTRDKPDGHPYLRLTRELAAGMVTTIEPGIYFIDSLLQKLRQGEHAAAVDFDRVRDFAPYGGIRIEDDVVCTDAGPENLTRDAFAAATAHTLSVD